MSSNDYQAYQNSPYYGNQSTYNNPASVSYKALTRGLYDDCQYKHRLYESTSPLLYQINPVAYESCNKCHQAYPGYLGALGGQGFGVGPDRVDHESDLRGQTRILTRCPTHKYNPHSYLNCKKCENCNQGLPCGCDHCLSRDISYLEDCRPGIIPIESLDTRNWNACSDLNSVHINRFDYLCQNPQDPSRIFFYQDNRRLGEETRMDMWDRYPDGAPVDRRRGVDCLNVKLPHRKACSAGSLGCRHHDDFGKNIYH